jgi:hypothetical protein
MAFASSRPPAPVTTLLSVCQWSGVDDEDRFILVEDEDHLEEATARAAAPDEPFVVAELLWIGLERAANDLFRFIRRNTMHTDVPDVPLVPSEFHQFIMQ